MTLWRHVSNLPAVWHRRTARPSKRRRGAAATAAVVAAAATISTSLHAGALLPPSTGAVQLGYRAYAAQATTYDAKGDVVPLGGEYNRDLSGPALQQSGNADLEKLASELAAYDQSSANSLASTLNLGRIETAAKADVTAQIVGVAYGVTRRLTVFAGVPWIKAEVATTMRMAGSNNALEVRDRLGDLAFDELRDGLVEASTVGIDRIKQALGDAGYNSLERWSYTGPGDARLGATFGDSMPINKRATYLAALESTLTTPTGRADDPDQLTDIAVGTGYYSLSTSIEQRVTLARQVYAGGSATYQVNADARVARRVPRSDEAVVDQERKTKVSFNPGDDTELAVFTGYRRAFAEVTYRLGQQRHYGDRYHGSVAGNYAALGAGSEQDKLYHRLTVGLDTIQAFERKKFVYPFIAAVSAQRPLAGRNVPRDAYYELSLTGFFSTGGGRR